ncbi:hypothetical protein EVG20_g2938 [Dentipellis fragilis]|uniref:Uncharacterized protein n=1 Tax=Dentipellis fragilis TaxID=205917 RepID=A0A4Y9Z812_9AGAM|nr:hypothetical protein EVG20_g2938 [Dentipellis fragilis]
MTTGQASYQQHASGLAPPADYPSLSSSGAHMQPPQAGSHTIGPSPVPSHLPATGRPRSRSVQQGPIPPAGHPAVPSSRPRRISHAVSPSTVGRPSHAYAVPSSTVVHQVGSSSSAHGSRMYPESATFGDSRTRPSQASQVAPSVAGPSHGSRNSITQPPADAARTRKGKEPLKPLYTRKPLQFKRPAENSRPSSLIQSEDEGVSTEEGRGGEGWRYSAHDSLKIKKSAKKIKYALYTPEELGMGALTDADVVEKGADMLAQPGGILWVKNMLEMKDKDIQRSHVRLSIMTKLYMDEVTRNSGH